MTKTPPNVFDYPPLLSAPVRRAAYSDRTSWLMASMSELAYWQFEGGEDYEKVILDLVLAVRGKTGRNKSRDEAVTDVRKRIKSYLAMMGQSEDASRKALEQCLEEAGFVLDETFNNGGSQGFLCHRQGNADTRGMRILAFRGTEQNFKDFKTDLKAHLIPIHGGGGQELVHAGFQDGFDSIRAEVEESLKQNEDLPLYITGHSLGAALATLATWHIASSSLGACYTFGGPRVGNLALERRFKTPIYRVVNAADLVPRVPPAYLPLLIALLKWVPLPLGWLIKFLERFAGYVHFGDMRFLTHVVPGSSSTFDGLLLLSNPAVLTRSKWVISRWINTWGKCGVEDHSVSLYRMKLKAYAIGRNKQSSPI